MYGKLVVGRIYENLFFYYELNGKREAPCPSDLFLFLGENNPDEFFPVLKFLLNGKDIVYFRYITNSIENFREYCEK